MRAVVHHEYGSPAVLRYEEIDIPVPTDGELLVRVRACAVNPGDWDLLHGTPYILRAMTGLRTPKSPVLGLAVAGLVESVGAGVSRFKPGDEVLAGIGKGGFAEFVRVPEASAAAKPSSLTFEQASTLPISGTTALQAMRDTAGVHPGQSVLVNGASGGVGTFAIQVAKAFGAEVTAVCSTANIELVTSLGADHVVDYTREDFTTNGRHYDVILDNVGNRHLADCRRALNRNGMFIPNSNKGGGKWIGAYLARAARALIVSPFVSQRLRPFASTETGDDLDALVQLVQGGKVIPVIDRIFPLRDTASALAYYGEGHVRGKVVVTIDPDAHPTGA